MGDLVDGSIILCGVDSVLFGEAFDFLDALVVGGGGVEDDVLDFVRVGFDEFEGGVDSEGVGGGTFFGVGFHF